MKTIGVIGLGSIGIRHAKNLLAMGYKVYGFDLDQQKEIEFAKNGGAEIPVPFKIATDCDAVVIATPSGLHEGNLLQVIAAGIPVFVEKPIATAMGDWLRDAVTRASRGVMVGNNLRFHSCVKKAHEWLDAGLIGKPMWANFTLAQHNTKYTEDVVLNWGSHELDLARYLLGPCWVKAAVGTRDIADIILMHDSACRTTVHLDYVTEPEIRFDIIQGTEGAIEVDLKARTIGFRHKQDYFKEWEDFPTSSFDLDYITEMQTFINMIDGVNSIEGWEVCAATGADGLAVLELCLEAKRLAGI